MTQSLVNNHIIVMGAGPLGSLIAARLQQGGRAVRLLARGPRLEELRQHGIVLKSWSSGREEIVQVPLIEDLEGVENNDLIVVVMRKNLALEALPMLAKTRARSVLFLMNNAAGPQAMLEALGAQRVLIGFAGAGGYREGHKVVYMNAEEGSEANILLGTVDGKPSPALDAAAASLNGGLHLKAVVEEHMDAWSKYHVALLFPSVATALYLSGNDAVRMANTRDARVLAWRAFQEGFAVLRKLGYPVQPPALKKLLWVPEPVMVAMLGRLLRNPRMEVALARHARNIQDEINQLNAEFLALVKKSGIFTPHLRFLVSQYQKQATAFPEGSRSMRLRWGGILIPILLLVCAALLLALIV